MLELILNTAEKRVQFVLCDQNGLLCAQDWLAERNGTEILLPALERAMSALDLSASALERIACVSGPGNFTGIRLGLSTSAGLARAVGAKQAGLNYLHCLACGVYARAGQKGAVLVNARRGCFFFGLYAYDEHGLPRPLGQSVLLADQTPDLRIDCDFALGSALEQAPDKVRALCGTQTLFLPSRFNAPSPEALILAASVSDWELAGPADPAPLYLRDCDAVENLEHIALQLGLEPETACARLQTLRQAAPDCGLKP